VLVDSCLLTVDSCLYSGEGWRFCIKKEFLYRACYQFNFFWSICKCNYKKYYICCGFLRKGRIGADIQRMESNTGHPFDEVSRNQVDLRPEERK